MVPVVLLVVEVMHGLSQVLDVMTVISQSGTVSILVGLLFLLPSHSTIPNLQLLNPWLNVVYACGNLLKEVMVMDNG